MVTSEIRRITSNAHEQNSRNNRCASNQFRVEPGRIPAVEASHFFGLTHHIGTRNLKSRLNWMILTRIRGSHN